jgi:hypothetical protein
VRRIIAARFHPFRGPIKFFSRLKRGGCPGAAAPPPLAARKGPACFVRAAAYVWRSGGRHARGRSRFTEMGP